MNWEQQVFEKLARAGCVCFLPLPNGKHLLQKEDNGDLRPVGGGTEKIDKDIEATILRELEEEMGLDPAVVKKKLVFLGFEPRKKYFGSGVFELKGHKLKPGRFVASNDPNEIINLVECTLDHPRYTGPTPHKLLSEEAKNRGEKFHKQADAEGGHHHWRTTYDCGHTNTCRCTAPKVDRTLPGECPACRMGLHKKAEKQQLPRQSLAGLRSPFARYVQKHYQQVGGSDQFEDFVVTHNRNDCDAGELHGVSEEEMERIGKLWAKQGSTKSPEHFVGLAKEGICPKCANSDSLKTKLEISGKNAFITCGDCGIRTTADYWHFPAKSAHALDSREVVGQPRIVTYDELIAIGRQAHIAATGDQMPSPDATQEWCNRNLAGAHDPREQSVEQPATQDSMGQVRAKDTPDYIPTGGIEGKSASALATPSQPATKPSISASVAPGKISTINSLQINNKLIVPDYTEDRPVNQMAEDPKTGPEAIAFALQHLDLTAKEKEAKDIINRRLKSKRPLAVQTLGFIQGFKRSGLQPADLMIQHVPVIPPAFRPYTVAGDVFIPGDANELYRDLLNLKSLHGELESKLGPAGAAQHKLKVYDAAKALYGYGTPTSPKTKERGVSGFLQKITGTSPKFSYVSRQMLSKNQDYVGRSVIGVDPDLGLDEIAIPDEMAWKLYAPYVQRRLVRAGMTSAEAVKHIQTRSAQAAKYLDGEMTERPVMYSRSPAWHRHSVVGGYAKRVPGSAIMVNPYVTAGLGADFDGDSGRFYIRIQKNVDIGRAVGDAASMLNTKSKLRVDDQVIHIQNFPHLPETKQTTGPGVTEYDVPRGTRVYALNRDNWKHEWLSVTKFSVHDGLEMWQVTLCNGRTIFTSSDHSLVAYKEGKLELVPPSEIARLCVPRIAQFARRHSVCEHVVARGEVGGKAHTPVDFKLNLNYATGAWLGMLIGDGCIVGHGQVYLYGSGDKAVNRARFDQITKSPLLPYAQHVGASFFTAPSLGGGESDRERSVISNTTWFSRWLQEQTGHGALEKRIPDFSLNASLDHLWGLLDGLISTDGTVHVSRGKKKPQLQVAFATSSVDLVAGFQVLLERLGIKNSVTPTKSPTSGRAAYIISLSTVSLASIHAISPISFNHPLKNKTFQEFIGTVQVGGVGQRGDQIPYPHHLHKAFEAAWADRNGNPKRSNGKSIFGNFGSFKTRGRWDRSVAARELAVMRAEGKWDEAFDAYQALVDDISIAWEAVETAHPLSDKMTGWDITVPGAFTFALEDGIIVQDTANVHVPSMASAVDDVKTKLMPSSSVMIHSIKKRGDITAGPKQEGILGAFTAQNRPAKNTYHFPTEAEALAAIKAGHVKMSDEITIG